jgi:hypothetical protein
MREYKFYVIRKDGHIDTPPSECVLPNDLAAVAQAKALTNGHDIEIWQGARIVAYVTSDEK